MTSTNKRALRRAKADRERDARPKKVEVKLNCDCGVMLVPEPFVEDGGMRISYNCSAHGRIHVVDPFAETR
jgi:hypothetical protein